MTTNFNAPNVVGPGVAAPHRGVQPPPLFGPHLPRYGEPGWSVWPRRVWPVDSTAAAPHRLLAVTMLAAAVGTAVWRVSVLSIGYPIVGVLVFGVVYSTAGRRPTPLEWPGVLLTLGLLTVPAVLAAPWLGALCIAAAWVVGWCTLAGGRTWTAAFVAPFLPWCAPARVLGWVQRSGLPVAVTRVGLPRVVRVLVVLAVTGVLALVFGGLFAAADPAFASIVDRLVPSWNPLDVWTRTVVFAIVAGFILLGAYLVRFGPHLDALAPEPMRPVPSWEWALPLAVVDALFVGFVIVQAAVLFGGHDHVLQTEGLTYAEYARQGFWQLLWVSALTLLVLSAVVRVAGRTTAGERRLLRVLIGTLCATSVVVVFSAIHRMWLYQQAYGFSTQRLVVITIEVWLAVVFILVACAGVTMRGRWLPRAILWAGAVAVLGLAAINPDRLIAERNIDRYERTGLLDTAYLLELSADVDPALRRLPEPIRHCASYLDAAEDPWYEFNLSRSRVPAGGTWSEDCAEYWSRTS